MIIVDVNLLLYPHFQEFEQHQKAKQWLEEVLSGTEEVGLPWVVIWGFIRIATQHFSPEVEASVIFRIARDVLSHPLVTIPQPGRNHTMLLETMAIAGRTVGTRLTDSVLAALAIEHGATVASADKDFARFPGLKWINPVA